MKRKILREEHGITLIALIITIIIMLILVAVTISILINSGLIGKAKKAGEDYKTSYEQEQRLGDSITIDGVTYNSIDEYLADLNSSNPAGAGTLTITTNEIETESRAVILEVSVDGETVPTEEDLQTLEETNEEQVKSMFLKGLQSLGAPYTSWNQLESDQPFNGVSQTVQSAFEAYSSGPLSGYTNPYDFIIQTKAYLPDTAITCNGQTVTGKAGKGELVLVKNGNYTITAANTEGTGTTNVNITKCKIEEFSSIQTTKQTLTIDGFTVTIPAGFAYGTSANIGHVTTGLVITDSVENVNGQNYSNGNEFVWIPVDENLKVGTASNNKVMARISSGTDYEGVPYDFSGTGNSTTSTEKSNYGVSTTSWREPAIVAYDTGEYSSQGITLSSLQNEYNAMIASIKANKGFYVGRYEMGIENNKAVSKLGITPATAHDGCTNEETGEGALRWYGLYDKAKTYTNSSNSVQSHMIWGAEYDAMLNFALEDTNENTNSKGKVTSTEYGNYGLKPLKTGTTTTLDKIINIYDLGGNMREWTAEADVMSYRASRGGSCSYNDPASIRGDYNPNECNSGSSCRSALYIK